MAYNCSFVSGGPAPTGAVGLRPVGFWCKFFSFRRLASPRLAGGVETGSGHVLTVDGPMRYRLHVIAFLICAVGAQGIRLAHGQLIIRQNRKVAIADIGSSGAPSGVKLPQLVTSDDEWAGHLAKAEELVEDKQYSRAIEILQALIVLPDSGFVPTSDGQRFMSLWNKVNDVIGRMDEQGLKLYRDLYDPQAERLYDQAIAAGDEGGLRQVIFRYLHTSYGPPAMMHLGAVNYDRGRFILAARCWRQALALLTDDADKPLLLTKIATAMHLAGETDASRKVIETLTTEFPGATSVLAGRSRTLSEFAPEIPGLSAWSGEVRSVQGGWPGLGGVADGMAIMHEGGDVVLVPRWRHPDAAAGLGSVEGFMVAGKKLLRGFRTSSRTQTVPKMRNGHVYVETTTTSSSRASQNGYYLTPMIHPVVVGKEVIYRTDDLVGAFDAETGEFLWRSVPLPMFKPAAMQNSGVYYSSSTTAQVPDSGHYGLTVGGGLIYALSYFRPPGRYYNRMVPGMLNATRQGSADNSRLTALAFGGKVRWRIGDGAGDAEMLQQAKFISLPTYTGGRLYVIATHLESYHLLCIDAETGSLTWSVIVSQAPAMASNSMGMYNHLVQRASMPALADGVVYVLTNAGVVAAFEAETGRALWAYQYNSTVNRSSSSSSSITSLMKWPVNPLVVARDRLICLPTDSDAVLALSTGDGKPCWASGRGSRENMKTLSAIDADRVLLSGPGLTVLSTQDGTVRKTVASLDIVGRPAVTPATVLASGKGRVLRMGLEDYDITTTPLSDANGLLGNLVNAGGKLIAANTLGVCVYDDYDRVYAGLTDWIAQVGAADRATPLMRRARLAFDAGRFDDALKDFLACSELAAKAKDTSMTVQLQPWLNRTYTSLANRSETTEGMLKRFRQAEEYAETDQEKARATIRLAKCYERLAGERTTPERRVADLRTAIGLARVVADRHAREELVDLPIGKEARDETSQPQGKTILGEAWARTVFIPRLLEIHGRDVYVDVDARAKAALDEARGAGDIEAILAVVEKWPNSRWVDEANFAASEARYLQAEGLDKDEARKELEEPRNQLRLLARKPSGPMPLNALVGVAATSKRMHYTVTRHCDRIREICAKEDRFSLETVVAFADIRGPVGDVLKQLEGDKSVAPVPTTTKHVATIQPPLAAVFALIGNDAYILRDQEYRPVRIGEKIVILKGGKPLLLDTAAARPEDAVVWTGSETVEAKGSALYTPGYGFVGGLSADGKAVLVADQKNVTAYNASSGKLLWTQGISDVGVAGPVYMATGDGVFVAADRNGKIACLDMATGKLKWPATLTGTNRTRRLTTPPRISGGVVTVEHGSLRRLTAFETRTGRSLGTRTGQSAATGYSPERDALVRMVDGVLAVLSRTHIDAPRLTRKYNPALYPAILDVGPNYVIVSPSQKAGGVEFIRFSEGAEPVAVFTMQGDAGRAAIPVDAVTDGEAVYVACGQRVGGRRKQTYGRLSQVREMTIQKQQIGSTKAAWVRKIDGIAGGGYLQVLPMTLGREHLVVVTRKTSREAVHYACVLDTQTGKIVCKIELDAVGGNSAEQEQRMRVLGPAVMMNGRLVLETAEGLVVYGSK